MTATALPTPRIRRVHMFVDDKTALDFHSAFVRAGESAVERLNESLVPNVELKVYECFGSQQKLRTLVLEVASQLDSRADDLICLFPTDAHAIDELQSALFADAGPRRQQLVCAVMHQTLSKELVSKARDMGKRLFSVGADQARMGALQAEQIRRLLSRRPRSERKIVYVIGPDHSTATRLRIAGAVELLLESDIAVEATHAEWSGNRTVAALNEWQAAGGKIDSLAAIAAQNDQIAQVAKKWLIAKGKGHVPVVGMDGTDDLGKQLVIDGTLTATVEQPLGVAEALDIYRRLLTGELDLQQLLDEPNRRLPPNPYPEIEQLEPL